MDSVAYDRNVKRLYNERYYRYLIPLKDKEIHRIDSLKNRYSDNLDTCLVRYDRANRTFTEKLEQAKKDTDKKLGEKDVKYDQLQLKYDKSKEQEIKTVKTFSIVTIAVGVTTWVLGHFRII